MSVRLIVSASVLVGCFVHSVAAQAQSGPVLWQNVRAGMTEAELRAAIPTLQPSDRGTLVQNGVSVVDMPFNAYIELDAGRVKAVQLQGTNADAAKLADRLGAKYGAATSPYKCDAPSIARKSTAVWNTGPGTAVTMTALFAPSMSIVSLRYEATSTSGL